MTYPLHQHGNDFLILDTEGEIKADQKVLVDREHGKSHVATVIHRAGLFCNISDGKDSWDIMTNRLTELLFSTNPSHGVNLILKENILGCYRKAKEWSVKSYVYRAEMEDYHTEYWLERDGFRNIYLNSSDEDEYIKMVEQLNQLCFSREDMEKAMNAVWEWHENPFDGRSLLKFSAAYLDSLTVIPDGTSCELLMEIDYQQDQYTNGEHARSMSPVLIPKLSSGVATITKITLP